ncbi:Outer membrane receptor proteins, mostly Fe transport [Pseudarcicella hirudinis]|uniref:Outer membrane receptor proteins, mostly Fe transport n=1 Tax=Pseudarcicella hirudinis TaxID=1079859 RepID=A0A1I5TIJ3_9BACT|nr:TonB-dependent receptor [Pseudarcicella hirudinis]SFP82196.1 Outer membrane receptor proteins, mostly Fe transport [Pseudarcicella hirudinis]
MKTLYQIIILTFCILQGICLKTNGQTLISGVIRDKKNKPIEGASVTLKGTYDGAATVADGSFSFETTETGEQTIIAHSIGYKDSVSVLNLNTQPKKLALNIQLTDAFTALDVVTVKGKGSDFLVKDGSITLHSLDIRAMGGSNADIGNAFRIMPGVQPTSDATGLLVRGGTSDETRVFVDGMAATTFFYTGGPDISQRSRFSPELFSGNFFSSGGYSAMYGQALSSTLILDTRKLPDRSTFNLNVGSIGANMEFNKLLPDKKQSFGASLNYSNLQPYYQVVKQYRDFTTGPAYLDATVNYRLKVSKNGYLKFLGMYGNNAVSFYENNLDQVNLKNYLGLKSKNLYGNISFSNFIGNGTFIQTGLSYSSQRNQYELDTLAADQSVQMPKNQRIVDGEVFQARAVIRKILSPVTDLYTGMEYFYSNDEINNIQTLSGKALSGLVKDHYWAGFAESNWKLSDKIEGRTGVRLEYSSVLRQWAFSPRATINYTFAPKSRLFFSYGDFYQKPLSDYLTVEPEKRTFQKSTHYILGFQKEYKTNLIRMELYHKDYSGLIKTIPDINSNGKGYAQGAEVFWKNSTMIRNLEYWISYSYLDTKREYLNFPVQARPNFAAEHTASLALRRYFSPISTNIGLTYTYASGRPYFNPNRSAEDFMKDKTIDYHNIGLTVAHLATVFKANAIIVGTVSNLLGNEQVFGYKYSAIDFSKRQAITPMASRFFYLGIFLNWGIDKREKTMNDFLNQ